MDNNNDVVQKLSDLLDTWWRRKEYLQEVLKVEERYYPEKINVTDSIYARKEELIDRINELQALFNELKQTTNGTTE